MGAAGLVCFGSGLLLHQWPREMGQMSDYDIWPKPKVWAGSPNECQTFGRMLYARMNQLTFLNGECTEWPGNVVVGLSKNVSASASSEMENYAQTKLASWCCLSNLQMDHFLRDSISQFAEFSVLCFLNVSDFHTASVGISESNQSCC